jgi:arginase family enzyme
MRPRCREALRALRDASSRFRWLGELARSSGYFDIGRNAFLLSRVRMVDVGDVDVTLDTAVTCERIAAHARSLIDCDLLLASIGGDHSISFPLPAAFDKNQPLTVILLDAHPDYRDRSNGMEFTNNSPFRRAHELSFIKRIVTVGAQGLKARIVSIAKALATAISSSLQIVSMTWGRRSRV